jgi:hypothetical protein
MSKSEKEWAPVWGHLSIIGPARRRAMNIEDTIFDEGMAINSLVALGRLIDILCEHNTNTILDERVREDARVRRLFWFLNSQMYGQLISIDQYKIWNQLYKEWEKGEQSHEYRLQ